MSSTPDVKKGDRFVAGGTAKVFEVKGEKDGIITLEEDVSERPEPENPDPEVVSTTANNLYNQDDWKGAED